MTLSTALAAFSRQVLGLQHLRSLTVACTRVVTLDTPRIVTFPRLLKFSMTPVLIPFGVRTLSGPPSGGQAPVGAYERNLSGPPVQRSSYQSGLKRGTLVTPVGVESPVGDSTGGGFCALPSGADSSQGRDVGLKMSGLRFLALPVGRSGWPVLVPCPLSLLVVSLVVSCFFGCVSSLRLKRTGAPTP